jgi:pimeloyl-ACP methyl ester carboxylesterase
MKYRFHQTVSIPVSGYRLEGELLIPSRAAVLVLFAHGSGSSRHSRRNQLVAAELRKHGMGTLLFDLLTEAENERYYNRFHIDLLAGRLVAATHWLRQLPAAAGCALAYFGASTGAAAALQAVVAEPGIGAVVSRGGRPDLCNVLQQVTVPVLLIVGSRDEEVLRLNISARAQLHCESELAVVEGATHLFEEPGKLEEVAGLAAAWFENHLHPVGQEAESFLIQSHVLRPK